jgi:putative ABC transport system permease protein
MVRDRTFALASILTLMLAIGLNATVFTIMDAMLFRGYPFVNRNDRLVYLQEHFPGVCCTSYADFEDWRSQAKSFEDIAFVGTNGAVSLLDGEGRSTDVPAERLSANTFGLLGVRPIVGRDFEPTDEEPGAAQVTILNYDFWERRFAKRTDIVGSVIHINGSPATIIGVMPKGFIFAYPYDLWLPVQRTPALLHRGPAGYMAVGRLREGATFQQARVEIETINRRLETAFPETNRGVVPSIMTFGNLVAGESAHRIFGSLWAGACLVLLIACANVANLMLVRSIRRSSDFSTRIALGAAPARIARQLLLESAMLTAIAGTLSWLITKWAVRQWAVATVSRFQILDYSVDSGIFSYLIIVSVIAALLCPFVPMIRVVQTGVHGLKNDNRAVTQSRRSRRLAAILVAAQMALAVILLSGAGVLVRSFMAIVGAETGVHDPDHILVGLLILPSEKYRGSNTMRSYLDHIETQLRTVAGVEQASLSSWLPVYGGGLRPLEIEGRPGPANGAESAMFLNVGASYFQVVRAPAIAGREFSDDDRESMPPVALVNQSFADKFFPGEQPIGKRLRYEVAFASADSALPAVSAGAKAGEWRTVVGVVPNIMEGDPLRRIFKPIVYLPFRQEPPSRRAYFLIRTRVPPEGVAPGVRAAIQKLDDDVLLTDFTPLKTQLGFKRDNMDPEHSELGKQVAVAPVFAFVSLVLAAIGLLAVIAHSVSQRTREIGIRMALGAMAIDIRRMILLEGMLPVIVGMFVGLLSSLAVNRGLQSQLVGVAPYDPVTMTTAPIVLIIVALLACQIPARRATRVDSAVALRHD